MPKYGEPNLDVKPIGSRYKAPKHVLKLYIPTEDYETIARFAGPRGFSISGFVRGVIRTYCRQQLEKEGRLLRAKQITEANRE